MAGVSEGETVCGMVLRVQDSLLSVCEYTRDGKKRFGLVGGGGPFKWMGGGGTPGANRTKRTKTARYRMQLKAIISDTI
jgi:hypothetical protein